MENEVWGTSKIQWLGCLGEIVSASLRIVKVERLARKVELTALDH
jgi:hypothetical protein